MTMKSLIDASIIFIAAALMLAYSAWGQTYTVTDLGNILPSAITQEGVIIGYHMNGTGAIWHAGMLQSFPGIGTLLDANSTHAVGTRIFSGPETAIRMAFDGTITVLPVPPVLLGGSYANTISTLINGVEMVGGHLDFGVPFPVRWFTHENFAEQLFAPPGGGAVNTSNALGLTAGFVKEGNIDSVARWDYDGNLTILGTLGGNFAYANDMNDAGQMVGHGNTADGRSAAFRSTGDSLTVLPIPQGFIRANAWAINRSGAVVGDAYLQTDPNAQFNPLNTHALRWDANAFPTDLNTLVSLPAGWVLTTATGIADDGRIIGTMTHTSRESRGVLLTPAASAPLALGLSINQASFQPGQRLDTALTLRNPGPQRQVDMYVGIIFPDGWVWWVQDMHTFAGTASDSLEADPRTFAPLLANMTLVPGLNAAWEDFIEHTWTGVEGLGTYHLVVGWTAAGSLQDGRIDEGDLLALDWKAFTASGAAMARR